jgi:hypothetical protein
MTSTTKIRTAPTKPQARALARLADADAFQAGGMRGLMHWVWSKHDGTMSAGMADSLMANGWAVRVDHAGGLYGMTKLAITDAGRKAIEV